VPGHAAQNKEVREYIDHIDRFQLSVHSDGQALMRELVDHVEHPVLPPVMGAILHEVVAPDVVRPLGSQPDARSVTNPKATSLRLLLWHFQPLPSPDPLDPLIVDNPTGPRAQELCDLAVAVTAVLAGELNDVGGEALLIVSSLRNTPLR
jgi:hypothetical protein